MIPRMTTFRKKEFDRSLAHAFASLRLQGHSEEEALRHTATLHSRFGHLVAAATRQLENQMGYSAQESAAAARRAMAHYLSQALATAEQTLADPARKEDNPGC